MRLLQCQILSGKPFFTLTLLSTRIETGIVGYGFIGYGFIGYHPNLVATLRIR